MKQLLSFLTLSLFALSLSAQGVTTAQMTGELTDVDGELLVGAQIEAIHTPSGTSYGTTTDLNGYYRISNLRVGGPYTIRGTYVGFEDKTIEGIFLSLGDKYVLNLEMAETSIELGEVNVVASRFSAGQTSGASTNISSEAIENMPTLNRGLNDFTKLTPQSSGTFGGGFSIAGTNNRYNAIYFDGAVNNDMFGLAANGTNGGQTGVAPISIDAIDQIQVVVSPYDVTLGGFAGGGINAVTKSGDNTMRGTAYYFLQNESFAGKTNGTLSDRIGLDDSSRTKLDDFSQVLYGASLGGPIIKDKVFFYVNAEIQQDETPLPFQIGDYRGDTDEEGLNQLSDFLQNQYGYDAGPFGSKVSAFDAVRVFAKLDFNLSDNHKLVLRHNYVKGEQLRVNGSNQRNINFQNNGVFFPTTTNSSALELRSTIGSSASNNLIVGYTSVRDDRDPIGQNFPAVRIDDGNNGTIRFGSEAFSTANQLDQDVLTITNNLKLYKGKHTITIGTHNEFLKVYNLFIRQNFGDYTYDSLDDFYNDAAPDFYTRSYSLVDDIVGDGSGAAAEFGAAQLGFYIQDEFQVNRQLTLSGGIRLDVPFLLDDPVENVIFNQETLPEIEARGYDLQGARAGAAPDGQLMFSPRIGFNYDIADDRRTILRGGLGVFTSRIPFVWPGGMFTNNGLTIGGFNNFQVDFPITFEGDIDEQFVNPDVSVPSGQMDLFVEDFKYPQVFRASLALDKVFGDGWRTTIEGIYTKTLNNVLYQNVNSDPDVDYLWTNGGDRRPIYVGNSIDNTYSGIYLASNTNEGYTYNVSALISKRFFNGLDITAAYSYGDAQAIFEGTSSQNSSQWRGAFSTFGRNRAPLARSDFSAGHRFFTSLNYDIDWTGTGAFNTGINFFLNLQSGAPYSYVYDARNINNEAGATNRERHLIFVPANQNNIALIDTDDATADEQWEALNKFIEEDDYLSTRRGQYAEKNGARTKAFNYLDFRLTQNIGINGDKNDHRLQLTFDVFNFLNLLNKDWGTQYGNPFSYEILNYEGQAADGTTPLFTFTEDSLGDDRFNIQDRASRWRGRLGIRYTFN